MRSVDLVHDATSVEEPTPTDCCGPPEALRPAGVVLAIFE